MLFFLPLGLEFGRFRVPVVGIVIALLCLAVFFPSWVFNRNTNGFDADALERGVRYWEERPYLELPQVLVERMGESGRRAVEGDRQRWLQHHTPPAGDVVASEQGELDAVISQAFVGAERNLMRRLALVPSQGLFQLGWVTHMFIHFGWLHLLGNLLFLWIVGPLLEEAWGRRLFAGFYGLGGLVAAFAHFLLDRHSTASMGGASGAIAACMGAFAVRFASKRIRVAYLVFLGFKLFRGIVAVPAWFGASQSSDLHLHLQASTPHAAWGELVTGLLQRSPARAISGAEAFAQGRYPRFRDEAELLAELARHSPGHGDV